MKDIYLLNFYIKIVIVKKIFVNAFIIFPRKKWRKSNQLFKMCFFYKEKCVFISTFEIN